MDIASIERMAAFAYSLSNAPLDDAVLRSVKHNLFDSFTVMAAGMRTPEVTALRSYWPRESGPCLVVGADESIEMQAAILLNATALCVLELDEGNKYARGHPGAHVLPAAFAEAQRLNASRQAFMKAWWVGYEVATKFARAFQPREGLHPHGNWGAIGAAVAIGVLNEFDVYELAQVIDAAAGLQLASPFHSALQGSFVRNVWLGQAGLHGATSARIVQAGLGSVDNNVEATLNNLLGKFDDVAFLSSIDDGFDIHAGYFKRHSSCNYTHPPADAAIELMRSFAVDPAMIESVSVFTHELAYPLSKVNPASRLAAMFSIPHVVAVALFHGSCLPEHFDPASLERHEVVRLRNLVEVRIDPSIEARRPAQRGARVEITHSGGITHSVFVPNSVGDTDHFPLTWEDLIMKAQTLLSETEVSSIVEFVEALCLPGGINEAARKLHLSEGSS